MLCVIDRLFVQLNFMMCDSYDKCKYAVMYCISCAAYFWLYVIFRSWPSTSIFRDLFVPHGEAVRLEAVCGSLLPGHLQLEFKDQLRGSSLRVLFTLIYLSAALVLWNCIMIFIWNKWCRYVSLDIVFGLYSKILFVKTIYKRGIAFQSLFWKRFTLI